MTGYSGFKLLPDACCILHDSYNMKMMILSKWSDNTVEFNSYLIVANYFCNLSSELHSDGEYVGDILISLIRLNQFSIQLHQGLSNI